MTPQQKAQKYGFSCSVMSIKKSLFSPLISYWLLDLQNILALLCSVYIASSIRGEPMSEEEREYRFWLKVAYKRISILLFRIHCFLEVFYILVRHLDINFWKIF